MANVTATLPRVELSAAALQTQFSWNFLVLEEQDLAVIHVPIATGIPVPLVNNVDYTIDPGSIENEAGGTITLDAGAFPTGAAEDDIFIIFRDTIIARLATF